MFRNVPLALLLEMAYGCFNVSGGMGISIEQWCWPDGKAMLDQPYWLVQLFGIFRQAAANEIGRKEKA